MNFEGTEFVTGGVISVSKLVHGYFPKFDADDAVEKMLKMAESSLFWHLQLLNRNGKTTAT